ncbi:MAG TPA: DUF3391 domain-containing protein [Nitrospira sp.]
MGEWEDISVWLDYYQLRSDPIHPTDSCISPCYPLNCRIRNSAPPSRIANPKTDQNRRITAGHADRKARSVLTEHAVLSPQSAPPVLPFEEEMPTARQVYQAATTIVQNAMHDTRLGRAINMDEVNRVVSNMHCSRTRKSLISLHS